MASYPNSNVRRKFNNDYDLSWRIAVALAWEELVPAAALSKEECGKLMELLHTTILDVLQDAYPKDDMDKALREYDDLEIVSSAELCGVVDPTDKG